MTCPLPPFVTFMGVPLKELTDLALQQAERASLTDLQIAERWAEGGHHTGQHRVEVARAIRLEVLDEIIRREEARG